MVEIGFSPTQAAAIHAVSLPGGERAADEQHRAAQSPGVVLRFPLPAIPGGAYTGVMLDPKFEDIAAAERVSIHAIIKSCDDLAADHDWHFHPQFELTWFIASSGVRHVGDRMERYEPGDIVLSGPSLPHCWRNDPPAPGASSPEWIVIQFTPDALGAGLLDLPEATTVAGLLEAARFGVAFDEGAARRAGPLLRGLVRAQGLPRLLRLLEALDILAGCEPRRLVTPDYHARNIVDRAHVTKLDRIMRYASEHFRGAVSQADLAEQMAMSPVALSKFVRAATGATFTQIVQRMRINEACRLLANGNARITDIALDCGYGQPSRLNHHFQQVKGMTPGEYRRRMATLGSPSGNNR